jgi:hypothetical protein
MNAHFLIFCLASAVFHTNNLLETNTIGQLGGPADEMISLGREILSERLENQIHFPADRLFCRFCNGNLYVGTCTKGQRRKIFWQHIVSLGV